MSPRWIFLALGAALMVAGHAHADDTLPTPKQVTVAQGLGDAEAAALLLPARRYYAFWNTGEERYAKEALAPDFTDLDPPPGRPQGPEGPLVASRGFRQAVPDLAMTVEAAWVVGDQVISRLHFTGHFTGRFRDKAGDGRAIAFDAVDIYTIRDGRIAANWHLEDNLTLLTQLGVIQ